MKKLLLILVATLFVVSACTTTPTKTVDGQTIYRIKKGDAAKIRTRHLNAVNTVRNANGLTPLVLSAQLSAAAETHAQDMSRQSRGWHFGSDGSSPVSRVARAGYTGRFTGENIAESYEDDFDTLKAWLSEGYTRAVTLDPAARQLGLGWYQENSGRIWWTQVLGN